MNDTVSPRNVGRLDVGALVLVLLFGAFIRIYPTVETRRLGFDEHYYVTYLTWLVQHGVGNYPELCRNYVNAQHADPQVFLPPTRVTYLLSGWLCFHLAARDLAPARSLPPDK